MPESRVEGGWRGLIARPLMLAGVLAWLWPIGLGGRMPVGGDATQFSMGLMAFLGESLRLGRLPLWNDLWGFGFPGLAESQMGVYYPPHWLLYGLLPTEQAGLTSLVLHTLWAAMGASWASRRLGTSEVGSALAGFSWATCGFFLIHLPHQWGFTVGSWMPWAWGLAWQVARGEGSRRTPWLLSAVLAIQVLPGHFQLAFVTEVGVIALALVAGGRSIGRRVAVGLAVASLVPLASLQLWPTYRLARLSESRRDFEYLSGFASPPIHFINYVAPGLFHRSPLWRPVAWDPFHTSPEELLGSIGLVPLFLAVLAIVRGWRVDPSVKALVVVLGLTVVLSLGPYAPGFGWLIRIPGFSFFRAPARWGLGTSLALSILAGRGFDGLARWPEVGRSARRFAMASLVSVLVVVLGFELALLGTKGDPISSSFDAALKASPWSDRPESKSFREVMAEAHRPQTDLRSQAAQARIDGRATTVPGPTLADDRLAIYRRELGETGAWLAALVALASLSSRPRAFAAGLLALTFLDVLVQSRTRPFDLGPALPLIEQSPVLARMAREPRGTRTLDPAQNLFLAAGVAPISSYRTLDLPGPGLLVSLARMPMLGPMYAESARAVGVGLRVFDPLETRGIAPSAFENWPSQVETIHDPALAGWILGVDLVRSTPSLQDFKVARPLDPPARAWLLPAKGLAEVDAMADPTVLLEKLRTATPLATRSDIPERVEVELTIDDSTPVPSMVVLSTTHDPEWGAWWSGPSGDRRPAEVVKVFGGWQGVAIPEPGRWTLHLEYSGRASRVGLMISLAAWVAWVVSFVRVGSGRTAPAPGPGSASKESEGGS